MGDLNINTAIVNSTIGVLRSINEKMYNESYKCDSAISSLNSSWDSPSKNKVLDDYISIKNQSFNNRKLVVDKYINFLIENVNEGYNLAENVNENLSEVFK